METVRTYKFRLNPTKEQEQQFFSFAGCRRYVWNWALATFGEAFHCHTAMLALTELKKTEEAAFLNQAVAQSLQQVLKDLERAFKNKREGRAGWPRWKSRHTEPNAFRFPQAVRLDGNLLVVPKIGAIPLVLHRQVEGTIKSATIKATPRGKWNVALVCHSEIAETPFTRENPVGLDVGLETFVTFSTGEKIAPPRFFRKQQTRIKRAHRRISRTQKRSKNRGKARRRLSSIYEKVRNSRQDFLHQLSHRIVTEHDCICIENLNLAALAKTKLRGHGKSWLDASQGEFRRQLEYKAEWQSKRIVRIDRFFPSSQLCSNCGFREKHDLSVREFDCANCGVKHDRDRNSAKNILIEGLTLLSTGTVAVMPAEEHIRPECQAGSVEAGKVPVSTTGSPRL